MRIEEESFLLISQLNLFVNFSREKNPESDDNEDEFEGYSMDLMEMISVEYPMKYKFVLEPNNKQGQFDKTTKKATGLIKFLLDGVSIDFSE